MTVYRLAVPYDCMLT